MHSHHQAPCELSGSWLWKPLPAHFAESKKCVAARLVLGGGFPASTRSRVGQQQTGGRHRIHSASSAPVEKAPDRVHGSSASCHGMSTTTPKSFVNLGTASCEVNSFPALGRRRGSDEVSWDMNNWTKGNTDYSVKQACNVTQVTTCLNIIPPFMIPLTGPMAK